MNLKNLLFSGLTTLLTIAFAVSSNFVFAQDCLESEAQVVVSIVPDSWPQEISWGLYDGDNVLLAEGTYEGDTLCFNADELTACWRFSMIDSYGDGLSAPGSYTVLLDGDTVINNSGNYGFVENHWIGCPEGAICDTGAPLTADDYGTWITSNADVQWYTFTPDQNGMYDLSSCGTNCDTRLWVYDYCNMNNFNSTNEGSIYYDDQEGGCEGMAESAQLTVLLEGGVTYWIRFTSLDDCDAFEWWFDYAGLPEGCMDEAACNYQPGAEIDNGSCIYPGDPDCTGPDLIIVTSAIENSLSAETMNVGENNCYIAEGCLNGYGERDLIRFTTHIKNIGDLDYYIGSTSNNDSTVQFEWGDCHNHWHYKGYAKYDLFDMDGNMLPIGFKNGFCVMDLECGDGGTGQYGCSIMGISAHCGDIYGSGLSCQWIDVTDVADGDYHLVVRVNWDYSPDALGRYENQYENNWGVVCINIDRSTGEIEVEQIQDCSILVDCNGDQYGTAEVDCTGECNGSALLGDLDADMDQDLTDAQSYVSGILGGDLEATMCVDADQDGEVTVADAALLAQCNVWNIAHQHPDSSGFHDMCNFPAPHITNPYDSVWFSLGAVNWEQGFVDINVLNPFNKIVGYQFTMAGLDIESVVSLADPIVFPITPSFSLGGQEIIGLSYENDAMIKHYEYTPLCRIYWIGEAEEEICIDHITDVINGVYHNTVPLIGVACSNQLDVSETNESSDLQMNPNLVQNRAEVRFEGVSLEGASVEVLDVLGRKVMRDVWGSSNRWILDASSLQSGAYYLTVTESDFRRVLRFTVK